MSEGKLLNAVFPEAPCLVWTIPTSRGPRVRLDGGNQPVDLSWYF